MIGLNLELASRAVLAGVGVPGWVMRAPTGAPAVMDIDYANSRQFYNGASYPSEAALLSDAGGTAAGIQRTFGPFVDPANPELLTNGDLSGGVTGWSGVNSGLVSVVAGELVLDGNSAASSPSAAASFLSAVGKAYALTGTYRRGTSASSATFIAAQSASLSPAAVGAPNNATTNNVTNTIVYGGRGSTSYIALRIPAATPTGTVVGDNFSVKECLPFKGFSQGGCSGIVSGVTPAVASGNKVIKEFAASVEGDRLRIVYDATGRLHFIVTYGSAVAADIDLGAVSVSTPFAVEWTAGTNRFAARLNSGASLTDTVGTMPGVGLLYIARSPTTGETFDGTISRFTVFGTERIISDMEYLEGDSYVDLAGVNGVSLSASLATASSRGLFSTGVGGSTLAQQLARVQANQGLTSGIFVHWDGDANGWGTVQQTMDTYASLIAAAKTSKFIIIPPCRRNNKTATDNAGTLGIQQAIAAAYPNNYFDAQAFLATLANGTTDNADVAAGYIPTSLLQADGTHLLATPMNSLASNLWTGTIQPKGW